MFSHKGLRKDTINFLQLYSLKPDSSYFDKCLKHTKRAIQLREHYIEAQPVMRNHLIYYPWSIRDVIIDIVLP